jgi:hypothetical protein
LIVVIRLEKEYSNLKIGKQEFRRTDFDSRLLATEDEGEG